MSLCYRCENRALWLETKKWRPRLECGEIERSKYSCYCFEPVKPIALTKDRGDKRPQFGPWMITSMSHRTKRQPELELTICEVKGGLMPHWRPKRETQSPEKAV